MKQPLQTSIWSFRDIRLVLPARAVSYAGDSIALVALMLRVHDSGRPGAVAALLMAFALPTVVMIPFAGRIVDGHDSRKVLVWASLLQAVTGVGLAFSSGLVATLALVCVLQLGQAVAGPAWGALIPRVVGEELVGRTTGTSQALIGVATLAGSAAGGLLVGLSGYGGALLVDASTFVGLAVIARLVRTRRRPEVGAVRERGDLMIGLRCIFEDRLLRILVPSLWVFVLVGEGVNVVEIYLIRDEVGIGAIGYGALGAATGAGAIGGAWITGRLKADLGRSRAVPAGIAGIGASCVLLGLATNVVMLAIGSVAIGWASGMLNAAVSTLMVTRTAEHLRGRVIAALGGTVRACSLMALPLGGVAGVLLGIRPTFITAGVLGVLAALVAGVLVLRSRLWTKDSAEGVLSH
ncbi:MFS transporter [Kribbella qitaiheensis]|uniref:MFS transporter n=1 Tax=Kribbella qitaiheensis TaxID=1544730 RepID=UPI00162370EE|nr:MFS transporter [Kribbella qitaiheensis]